MQEVTKEHETATHNVHCKEWQSLEPNFWKWRLVHWLTYGKVHEEDFLMQFDLALSHQYIRMPSRTKKHLASKGQKQLLLLSQGHISNKSLF